MQESARDRASGRRLGRGMIAIGMSLFVVAIVGHVIGLRLNLTSSIPPGIYRVTDGPVAKGAIVIACLPAEASAFAASRGFVPHGGCPDGRSPIGKTVAAISGDSVHVADEGIRVNGRLIPNSRPLERDSHDRSLPRLAPGHYLVPPGHVWLVSSYSPRSYDSRYFGAIPDSLLVSRVRPVLRFR